MTPKPHRRRRASAGEAGRETRRSGRHCGAFCARRATMGHACAGATPRLTRPTAHDGARGGRQQPAGRQPRGARRGMERRQQTKAGRARERPGASRDAGGSRPAPPGGSQDRTRARARGRAREQGGAAGGSEDRQERPAGRDKTSPRAAGARARRGRRRARRKD